MSKNPNSEILTKLKVKAIIDTDPDYFVIKGTISPYGNIDSYRDIVEVGAFKKDLKENGNERPILWQHDGRTPVGLGIFTDTKKGLDVEVRLPKDDSFVTTRVMPQVKIGSVTGLSIGYFTIEEAYNREENVNKLIELKLREGSIVTFPANEEAQITFAKNEADPLEMFKFADEKTDITVIESNKKGFMYCSEKEFLFPYAVKQDDEFKIIPRIVYMTAGEIAVNETLCSSEKQKLKEFVNKIYAKMGKIEPFFKDGTFFIDTATLKYSNLEALSTIFDSDNVRFSANAKEMIISSLCSSSKGSAKNEDESGILEMLKEANNNLNRN